LARGRDFEFAGGEVVALGGLFAPGGDLVELLAALGQLLAGHADGGVELHALDS
jgi:hypothetical protein